MSVKNIKELVPKGLTEDSKVEKRRLEIMFCLPGSNFTHNFLKSFVATIAWCMNNKINISVRNGTGSNIYALREDMLGATMDEKTGEIELFEGQHYDYILWIDSDMSWTPADIAALLEVNKDIVTGACSKKDGNLAVSYFFDKDRVILKPKMEGSRIIEPFEIKNISREDLKDYDCPVTVTACGFAFILIKRGVFEKMRAPWFMQVTHDNNGNYESYFSEDFSFCMRAAKAGFNIWLQPKARIGHQKDIMLYP